MEAVGLFAGIGGIELGLTRNDIHSMTLVENAEPARRVLARHFTHAEILGDITQVSALPRVDVVSAGFPCTDLSQAGHTAGLDGPASGLVGHVFRLLPSADPTWLLIENVKNMLVLDHGAAMHRIVTELEGLGYRWAYRLVDSRCTGVPQRRQRVFLLASRSEDPRPVLFADDSPPPTEDQLRADAFGFYWTEGRTGLGWARDALPTLKGGSSVGIPCPPALWLPHAEEGRAVLLPGIEDAEALQGFDRGWTEAARDARRWKLVGNAVTVGVSTWLGLRLRAPGAQVGVAARPIPPQEKWPQAAWGRDGQRWAVDASMWPRVRAYRHLLEVVEEHHARPLSARATTGFLARAARGRLRFAPGFLEALSAHAEAVAASRAA